jgi:thiol-disulfide isomerase/thioredoxin
MKLLMLLGAVAPAMAQGTAPPPTTPRFVLVEGQITDAHGAGQCSAAVTVRRKNPDGSNGDLLATATTNEMGDFVVNSNDRVEGEVVVTVSKPHYADLVQMVVLGGEAPPFLGEALRGNLTVSGRVLDVIGARPIAAARVVLESGADRLPATTGDDGRFTIAGASPGEAELTVQAEGFGREKKVVAEVHAASEQQITLKPERIIHVKVMDDQGRPIPDVLVECLDQPRGDLRQNLSDKTGLATFAGFNFDASTLAVRLTHTEYVSSPSFDRPINPPRDQRESTHEFAMTRAGMISGNITSAADDNGLQGARVFIGDEYSESVPRDYSKDDGGYTIRGVRPGVAAATVHLSGYAPELKTVEVKPGETTTLDVALEPALVLEGVVKTDQGLPMPQAEVTAISWRGRSTLGLRAITDAQGRFRMENAPHDEFRVAVSAADREPFHQTVRADAASPIEIKLPPGPRTLKPAGALGVGAPMPNVTVQTLAGESICFAELKGKTVLVEFWATWCIPCLDELPHFLAVKEKHGARKDFVMISISRDHDVGVVREHLQRHPKITWHQVVGAPAGAQQAADGFGVTSLPETFVIGPDGKIAAHRLRREAIERAVEDTLKAGP